MAGVVRGSGEGRSKKEAEQQAAERAWRSIRERISQPETTVGAEPSGPPRETSRPATPTASARDGPLRMPELPEVEVVRRGLERHVVGRTVADVEPRHPRAVRRHVGGSTDFADRLRGRGLVAARRRGKYLWLPLDGGDDALLAHLGMSGQLLVVPPEAPDERHLRVKIDFDDGGPQLRFVDQRTFGGLALSSGRVDPSAEPLDLPAELAHVAADPLEDAFDDVAFAAALRRRRTGLKRALLDQTLVSGIGNIYADEGLWRARLHYARATEGVTRPRRRGSSRRCARSSPTHSAPAARRSTPCTWT